MYRQFFKPITSRCISKTEILQKNNVHVAVLGACGGTGSALSLLLKQSPLVTKLTLYDIAPKLSEVVQDLSMIESRAKVSSYVGKSELASALKGAEIVIMTAGNSGKGGDSQKLFEANASIVKELAEECANTCPNAIIAILTGPVSSTLPLASEIMMKYDVYDPRKLIGISTLDTVRSNTFASEIQQWNPLNVNVPVIGGADSSSVPLFSQCVPSLNISPEKITELVRKVQNAEVDVTKAKAIDGSGNCTLAMAYAGARLATGLCQAKLGRGNLVECVYMRSNCHPDVMYFSTPCLLGPHGVAANLGIPEMTDEEEVLLENCIPNLKKNIEKGVEYANI